LIIIYKDTLLLHNLETFRCFLRFVKFRWVFTEPSFISSLASFLHASKPRFSSLSVNYSIKLRA
jgi:hypothetical protein